MQYRFDKIIDRRNTNALSVEGYKNYLFGKDQTLELPCAEDELINMWVADMEFSTAPEIVQALKKRVEHGIFGYTMIFGDEYLEAFLGWTQSRYRWTFDKHHLVTAQGIIPALYDLVGFCCRPDEKVLILTPSYAFFKHAADFNNLELVTSDLICKDGHYAIDFEDVLTKAKDEKTTLFILCSPHNPIGRIWTDTELKTLGDICLENNMKIIADEIHCDILRQGLSFTPLAKLFPESDQIITCMAPSKTFNLAGFMFANVIIPNDALRSMWKKKSLGVENPLSITAAQAAYTNGHAWLDALTAYLDQNFAYLEKYLKKHLPKAKFSIPQATYLAWIDLSAYFPAHENLTLFFANKAGVLLEGGNMFVSNAEGHIRVNLACPRAKLREGLKRITEATLKK